MGPKAKRSGRTGSPNRSQSGPSALPRGRRAWFAIALLLVVAASVLSLRSQSQATIVDVAAAVAGVAGLVAAIALAFLGPVTRVSRVAVAGFALLAIALVSAIASGRGWSAFMGQPTNLLGWGALAAVTAVTLASARLGDELLQLLRRFAWMALLAESVLAFALFRTGEIGTGTLPNSTIFGCIVVLLLPWTIVRDDSIGTLESRARAVTAFIAVAALAATGSRTALLFSLVWAVWLFSMPSSWSVRTRLIAIASILVVAATFAFLLAGPKFAASFSASALGDRPEIWRMSAHAVAARPLVGWGPDGLVAGGASISTVELARREKLLMLAPGATDPHNLLFWIAVSVGVPGLLAFFWFWAETVLAWRASLRDLKPVAPAIWAVVGCTVIYLTAPAALETLPLYALVLGVSLATQPVLRAAEGRDVLASRLGLAATAVLIVSCALFAADAATRAPLEVASQSASPRLASRAQSASNLWPFDAHLAYLSSLHWGYASLVDPTLAQSRPDLAAIQRAASLDARDPFYATERARTLRFYGEPAQSVDAAFGDVFRRYPAYPIARAEYATWLAGQGREAEARKQLEIAELVSASGSGELDAALKAARDAIGAGSSQ